MLISGSKKKNLNFSLKSLISGAAVLDTLRIMGDPKRHWVVLRLDQILIYEVFLTFIQDFDKCTIFFFFVFLYGNIVGGNQ